MHASRKLCNGLTAVDLAFREPGEAEPSDVSDLGLTQRGVADRLAHFRMGARAVEQPPAYSFGHRSEVLRLSHTQQRAPQQAPQQAGDPFGGSGGRSSSIGCSVAGGGTGPSKTIPHRRGSVGSGYGQAAVEAQRRASTTFGASSAGGGGGGGGRSSGTKAGCGGGGGGGDVRFEDEDPHSRYTNNRSRRGSSSGSSSSSSSSAARDRHELKRLQDELERVSQECAVKDHRLKLRKREARKLRKQNEMISKAADRGWQGHTKAWAKQQRQQEGGQQGDSRPTNGVTSNNAAGRGGDGAASGSSTLRQKQHKLQHESAELSTMSDSARLDKLKQQVDANPTLKMNEGLQARIAELEERQKAEQEAWAQRVRGFVKAKAEAAGGSLV
jgi:hypothetical protein